MGFVVLGEQDRRQVRFRGASGQRQQVLLQQALLHQLLFQPHRHGRHKGAEPARRKRQIGLQQPLKFDQRLLIKHDCAEVRQSDAPLAQTVANRLGGKPRIVLLARKPLFLGRRQDLPVSDQAGRAIVIESRDAQDIGHYVPSLSVEDRPLTGIGGRSKDERTRPA